MCNLKNNQCEQVLKDCRKIDADGISKKVFNNNEIASLYVNIDEMIKELEKYKKLMSENIIERNIDVELVPDKEKKVEVTNGNERMEFNPYEIYEGLCRIGKEALFPNLVQVQSKLIQEISDVAIRSACMATAKIKLSENKIVKIKKMDKKELVK